MSPEDLIKYRKRADLTQADMAARIGLSKSGYVALELNKANLRQIHELAVERALISIAAESGDVGLLPLHLRSELYGFRGLFEANPQSLGKDSRA